MELVAGKVNFIYLKLRFPWRFNMLIQRAMIWTFILLVIMLSVTSETVLAKTVDVSIVNFTFDPQMVTIEPGDSVRWTNYDGVPHTATSTANPPVWNSGVLEKGEFYLFQFTSSGSFPYYCTIHPYMTGTIEVQSLTAVEKGSTLHKFPFKLSLDQNYPNPFNQNTMIRYKIAGNRPVHIVLTIFNIRGHKLTELVNGMQNPGEYSVQWNGKDDRGKTAGSGIYFFQLKSDGFQQINKMTILQ